MAYTVESPLDERFTGRSLLLLENTTTDADFAHLREQLEPLVDPGAPVFDDRRVPTEFLWRYSPRYQIAVVPVKPSKLTLRRHASLGILAIAPERYLCNPGQITISESFPQIPAEPYKSLGVRDSIATGKKIRVALIDSGVVDHPDLAGRIVSEDDRKSFVQTNGVQLSHGTLCAGVICGPRSVNGKNGYGVAPDIRLFDAQVMADINSVADDTILRAIEWADAEKSAHVIVFAASSRTTTGPNPIFEHVGRKLLLDSQRLLIAAAGRASAGAGTSAVEHPANCQSIIATNSVDDFFMPMASSPGLLPAGDFVDFAAIGDALPSSSLPQNNMPGYGTLSGTSAATAFAAGIASLWAQAQYVRGFALWAALLQDGVHVPLGSHFQLIGSGILKAPGSILP